MLSFKQFNAKVEKAQKIAEELSSLDVFSDRNTLVAEESSAKAVSDYLNDMNIIAEVDKKDNKYLFTLL